MNKKTFVNWEILKDKLPAFIHGNQTDESLNKLIDFIEEDLILKKAEEIKVKRSNKDGQKT